MTSPRTSQNPSELGLPPRLEGLLSLLVASPMALLGCPADDVPPQADGSSSGTTGSSTGPGTTMADSTGATTSDGTTMVGTSSGTESSSGTTMIDETTSSSGGSTSSTGSTGEPAEGSSSSSGGGGGGGNICYHAGNVMDMCYYAGSGNFYEYICNYYINYYIAIGDIPCAQAYAEVYACIAALDCAAVAAGWYNACDAQLQNQYSTCYEGWDTDTDTFGGATDTAGGFDSGFGFIVGSDSGGFGSGGFVSGGFDSGGFVSDGGFVGSDGGFVGSDGGSATTGFGGTGGFGTGGT